MKRPKNVKHKSLSNGMIKVVLYEDGDVDIICHEQHVLTICETSDVDCINLFLIPIEGDIMKTEQIDDSNFEWTHELLANRVDRSKKVFLANEPRYKIV